MKIKNFMITGSVLILSALLITGCVPATSTGSGQPSSSKDSGSSPASALSGNFASSAASSAIKSSVSSLASSSKSSQASVSAASSSGIAEQTTTGTFLKLEWGDYLHLYITGSDGKEHSYFILKKIAVDPETLVKGQKIKVTWHNADTFLTQISQTENIDEATKIELLG